MKKISILLTKYSDVFSRMLHCITGCDYTHVSLGLEDYDDCFYSFNFKGFCIETIEKHRRRGVDKSICYQIEVAEESYFSLKSIIQSFEEHRTEYHYTKMGVFFALLHLPFQRDKHYFCSQFVAELLIESKAIALSKPANLYLPNQLPVELERLSKVKRIVPNVV